MTDVTMVVREVTDDDVMFWNRRGNETARKVVVHGDHIGAANIEVLRCHTMHDAPFEECWRVPFIVPGGDGTTYWFTMFADDFPAVAAVLQHNQSGGGFVAEAMKADGWTNEMIGAAMDAAGALRPERQST